MNTQRAKFFEQLKQTSQRYDWVLLGVVVALCVFGLAFLASTLSALGAEVYQREFLHQLIFGVWIGGIGTFVLARLDYHILFQYRNPLLLLTLGMLVFLASFILIADLFGTPRQDLIASMRMLPVRPFMANGAIRWIATPISNFQPSEFAKFTLLVYFASFLSHRDGQEMTWNVLKKPLYAFFLSAFLIVIQPDLGSVILTFAILASGMWVAKVPLKVLAPISIIVMVFGGILALRDYRLDRIKALFDPSSASAYQVNQVRSAIANGGMWGLGYGNSEFKQNNLIPESTTDAILGVIGEEMGFVFTTAFLFLYLVLFWRGLKIAREAPDLGGRALATGISVWIASQAFLNVTGITGLTPLKGLPLPFVSEGGSSLVIMLAAVGVLLNVSSQSEVQRQAAAPKPVFSKQRVVKRAS